MSAALHAVRCSAGSASALDFHQRSNAITDRVMSFAAHDVAPPHRSQRRLEVFGERRHVLLEGAPEPPDFCFRIDFDHLDHRIGIVLGPLERATALPFWTLARKGTDLMLTSDTRGPIHPDVYGQMPGLDDLVELIRPNRRNATLLLLAIVTLPVNGDLAGHKPLPYGPR